VVVAKPGRGLRVDVTGIRTFRRSVSGTRGCEFLGLPFQTLLLSPPERLLTTLCVAGRHF
jgi:hypothetical protein